MKAHSKIHQARLDEWSKRIADQSASGLTIREWCSLNNTTIHKFNYWKHLLKEELTDQVLPDIVPITIPDSLPNKSGKSCDSYNSYNFSTNFPTSHPISVSFADIRIDITSSDINLLPIIIKAVRNA